MTRRSSPAGTVPGPYNAITDVPGVRIGHDTRVGEGFLTGTTVVLLPPSGAPTAVEVIGGGPATRDTAALDLRAGGASAHAVVLTGGSAYGLAAAAGVLEWLAADGRGTRVVAAQPGLLLPLVPAAALYDLGRGGEFGARPDAAFGRRAAQAAADSPAFAPVAQGCVGAGTGAVTAELKGGIGTASAVLPGGTVVGALAAVNAHGSTLDPATGLPYALGLGADGEFPLATPSAAEHTAAQRRLAEPGRARTGLALPVPGTGPDPALGPNTVIGAVATDAPLDAAAVHRLAAAGQRGMARAISPVHSRTDGDTVFAVSVPGSDDGGGPDDPLPAVLAAAERAFARAIVHAVLQAESVVTPFGRVAAYRELYPGACAALPLK
ncbi:P1 family peptidase [Pseudonocardia xinjiangensis]|uniref:Peptidase S58 family protein n=1 Tax=Pseudonocardia xinjiangensis TaxID=75289 RepID=A0ABX1RHH8_9PSEU|nr:P1 family peptidase [Pseudonocardia xinjiangensis]NMH79846.1 peptidase S58 family protein [Pseudonocardia xinjiangensis]